MSRHGRHRAGVLSVLSVLVTAATAGIVGFGAFGPSSADGDADALVIAPGSVVTNNRSLDIAHIPPRVELGVLVDRSASGADKTAVYRQLVDEVIAQLSAQSVSLRVGLAGFSDYPVFPYGAPEDVPYRRELALGADPAQWHAATNAVTPSLGGGDGRESQLGAVAAALADAQTIDSQPLGFSPSGAAKFLLVPADHRFHVPGDGTCVDVTGCQGDYPGPPAAEVEASAQAAGVHVIGIATDQPNEDLEHLATATNGVVVIWPNASQVLDRATEVVQAILGRLVPAEVHVEQPTVTGCDAVTVGVQPQLPANRVDSTNHDDSTIHVVETVSAMEHAAPGLHHCTVDYGPLGRYVVDVNITSPTQGCAAETSCVTTTAEAATTTTEATVTTVTTVATTVATTVTNEPTTTTTETTEATVLP